MAASTLMGQRDRQELRRILRARFEILQAQLHQREHELQATIREQIEAEFTTQIREAKKRTARLEAKVKKIDEEAKALALDMEEFGVTPGQGRYPSKVFTYEIQSHWSPVEMEKRVDRAYRKLTQAAGLHKMDLRLSQLQLEEEIAIGALGSDEAKAFLEKIPDIDKILPLNGSVTAAIEASAIEVEAQEDDED